MATQFVNGYQPAADNASADVYAVSRKQGSIRRGVKFGEYSLVRIRRSGRVVAEREIENRRVVRKARTAAQDLRKGQFVGPDKCQAIAKSRELLVEPLTPESADLSGPHHHEHLPGLGQQLQDVVDQPGKIADDRDGGLVLAKGRILQISLINGREEQRRVGKELPSIFAREYRRGTGGSHDEVRRGTIGIGGTDEVDDRLFRRADKPCRTHDDLNDVHRSAGTLIQVDPEVAGEVVEDQVAAIVRLQQQDLSDRRLHFAHAGPSISKPASATHRNRSQVRRILRIGGKVILE